MKNTAPTRIRPFGARLLCLVALTACLGGCAGYTFQFANTAPVMDPAQQARINAIYVH